MDPGFREAMRLMRDHLDELVTQFEQEDDHGLRCWLLELIGAARSPGGLPVLSAQLASNDESLRDTRAPPCGHPTACADAGCGSLGEDCPRPVSVCLSSAAGQRGQ
jgi:hypothetical protein